jgi:hypothetical protein
LTRDEGKQYGLHSAQYFVYPIYASLSGGVMSILPSRKSFQVFLFCLGGLLCLFGLTGQTAGAQSLPLYAVSSSNNTLWTIDPLTGQTLTSVTITLAGKTLEDANGLAQNPITGQLFAIFAVQGATGRELVTIVPGTGVATDVGNTGDSFAGITFATNGTLYGVTGDGATNRSTLYTLSTTTGAPTFVKALGSFGTGCNGEAISFNPVDGLIYHSSGTPSCQVFETINPSTLVSTKIPLSGDTVGEPIALAHWTGNFFLYSTLNSLYLVTSTGQVHFLTNTGAADTFYKGFVFAGSAPTCPPLAPLYGAANLGPTGPSLFYSLDPTSGAPTLIGPIGFERVGGMRFKFPATLFGSGSKQEGGVETQVLITINPCTGAGTLVGNTGMEALGFSNVSDISVRHSTGVLYANVGTPLNLGILNTSTGQYTNVGPLGLGSRNGNGMAFSQTDTLFEADNIGLNTLNPASGVATVVAPLSFPSGTGIGFRVNAMDFQPSTGILYASVTGSSNSEVPENLLATINTANGTVTFFNPSSESPLLT